MEVLETTYGFVWCLSCGRIHERKSETEPIPFCRDCEEWMEVLLCDVTGCEEEATVRLDDQAKLFLQYRCEEHGE